MHENARISEKTRMSRRKLRTGWIEGREPGKDRRDSLCRLREKASTEAIHGGRRSTTSPSASIKGRSDEKLWV